MSDVLRSTTFQLEFKGEDGVAGIKRFTKAVSDADATVDALSETLGENVSVTYKTVQSSQELTAEARALVNQMERTNKVAKDLTAQYQHQSNMIGKTADEQEQLNAVYKLGANATEAQKQEIMELVASYQALRNASTGTQGSFRDLRGVSQQLGWQLQDVAVQAQLGTSAFIIFSQQGSQLAAAFGPTGALVGAFIAVAGALAGPLLTSLNGTGEAIDNLIEKVDTLGKATRQMEETRLRTALQGDTQAMAELNARIATLNGIQEKNGSLTDRQSKRLLILTQQREELSAVMLDNESKIDLITRSYNENTKAVDDAAKASAELKAQYGIELNQLKMNDRQIALDNALRQLGTAAKKEDRDEVTKLINKYYDEKDALEASEEALKNKIKTEKIAVNEAEKIAKQRFAAFEAETKSLIKQTETIDQEYNRRKSIVDDFVKFEGTSKRTDQAYAALEQWKTDRLTEQYNKRESVRKQIEQAQRKQAGKEDPVGFENELYQRNIKALESQKQRNDMKLAEEQRINALIEAETERHTDRLDEINNNLWIDQLETYGTFVDGIGGVFNRMQDFAEEGSKAAEALFYINQAIAMAQAIISTEVAAAKALELGPILGIPASTVVRGLGYASVGIIAGQTIAGAYDKGGTIPAGQSGIVSEYGDELVNGVLVKGPARVTSREDTAAMIAGGGSSVAITIENRIDGATYRTEQVDETTVRIIAEKVFHDNIDSGVAGTLGNRNSKATKQMKKSFNVRSSY